MTYSGFETAPADLAAAAPRFERAAEGLSTAYDRTVGELEGQGRFWGADEEFERGYLSDWRDAADLAAVCERTLRAMAEQLTDVSTAYQRTDADSAQSFADLDDALSAAFGTTTGRRR